MGRENRVRLSDTELEQVKATRQIVFDDTSIPMGVVIRRACEAFLSQENEGRGIDL